MILYSAIDLVYRRNDQDFSEFLNRKNTFCLYNQIDTFFKDKKSAIRYALDLKSDPNFAHKFFIPTIPYKANKVDPFESNSKILILFQVEVEDEKLVSSITCVTAKNESLEKFVYKNKEALIFNWANISVENIGKPTLTELPEIHANRP